MSTQQFCPESGPENEPRGNSQSTFARLALLLLCVAATGCSQLPPCSDPQVEELANTVLAESFAGAILAAAGDGKPLTVQMPTEEAYDMATETRTCKAIIKTFLGSEKVLFSIQWHDKSEGVIWLEFLDT